MQIKDNQSSVANLNPTDIEEAVVGAVLLESDSLNSVKDILPAHHFSDSKLRMIYGAAMNLLQRGEPVDMRTVVAELTNTGCLDLAGGPWNVAQLTSKVSSAANVAYHARIVSDYYARRWLIQTANDLTRTDESTNAHAVLEGLKSQIDHFYKSVTNSGSAPVKMSIGYKKRNKQPALTLNGHTLIYPGEICCFIGLPGQGKSAICESIVAAHHGQESFGFKFNGDGKKILMLDTERPPDNVSDSYRNIFRRLGIVPENDLPKLDYIVLSEVGNVKELRRYLEKQMSSDQYDLVLIDGILDFAADMNDGEDAADLVKWLRALTVKSNTATVVTMHPNKGTENVAGHLGANLYRWCRAMLFVRSVKGDKSTKEITAEPEMSKLSHADAGTFSPIYFSWSADDKLLMPCDYTPVESRGREDKTSKLFTTVLSDGKRLRFGELKKTIMDLGHSESTAKRWIKDAAESGLLNNSGAVYSLGSPPYIEGGVNLNLNSNP